MKQRLLAITVALSVQCMMIACNSNTDSTTTSSDSTDKKSTDTSAMISAPTNSGGTTMAQNDFVTMAANAGMMEVELGKLAQTNASAKAVKDYGSMLATDHTAAGNELKSLAMAKNISFPASMDDEHSMHVKDLSAKKGTDFDKAYIDMMIEGHGKVIDGFEKASKDSSQDADIRKFAGSTLPTLRKHLSAVKDLKKKM